MAKLRFKVHTWFQEPDDAAGQGKIVTVHPGDEVDASLVFFNKPEEYVARGQAELIE